jgi:hypothetical protein
MIVLILMYRNIFRKHVSQDNGECCIQSYRNTAALCELIFAYKYYFSASVGANYSKLVRYLSLSLCCVGSNSKTPKKRLGALLFPSLEKVKLEDLTP